ncbi:MAG: hypothetical protein GX133_11260 [Syntrophomonadaceae bacterium]|nr:hypothetical protein [Syntrophomonadaceae bacterium]
MDRFDLNEDDYYAVIVAKNVARRLLQHPDIKPRQVIGLGHALYALDRLPQSTPGSHCDYSIVFRQLSDGFEKTRYISFHISAEGFRLCRGGTDYDRTVGEDQFNEPLWEVRKDGYRNTGGILDTLEDSCEALLSREATIRVTDRSVIALETEEA